ncbi:MAG: hypothetical protein V4710_07840, partial [Verrucomicrobiota bacterium]
YPPTGVRFTIAAYDRNILVAASSSDSTSVTLASAKLPPGFGIGSPLLGSTVTAIDGATVTLAAKANATIAANPSQAGTAVTFAPGSGSVVISGAGDRALPLSAGGTLSIYSSNIHQGGVLRAPLGTINLGWDGSGTAPKDLITGQSVPVNAALTFASGGITSVSAVDPRTGAGLLIPYGINANGTSWIDPAGTDITASGLPIKQINLGGGNVKIHPGSWIDIQGGGDLYAYRFVTGKGGTQDLLASTNGFAVVPGYASGFAPYAPFNTSGSGASLAADPGYTNGNLKPGDRVYLGASSGLAAGVYTLLPARYALLPGAFLVTPQSGMPLGTQALPDGSNYVSGYRFNGLDSTRNQPLMTRFEVVSSSVIRDRSQYDEFTANQFLAQRAADFGTASQRLPIDAGHLIVSATQGLTLAGRVTAQASTGGDAGLVDISSPLEMVIGGPRTSAAGRIVLDATVLSGFGAESLLIGGTRQLGPNGTTITVKTSKLTVDNAGAALTAPDIILVATKGIDVAPGALIIQAGESSGENSTLLIGTSTIAGSGDGTLLRVTSDSNAQLIRAGVTASTVPTMNIGAGAFISGHSLTLDSTASTFLASTGRLRGDLIALSSGRISLQFDDAAILQPNPGLILSGAALAGLESASSLSLTSYSTFDLYGAGTFHARGSLALHAAEIRNFAGGGTVTFSAPSILLDNRSNGTGTGSVLAMDGTLRFDATRIRLGSNLVNIDQFANVELKASGGLLASGVGGLATQGALKISAPLITGGQAAKYTVTAGGALVLESMAGTGSAVTGGLGASLTLKGASIVDNADIILPSGNLTLHATGIDGIVIGNLADTRLDVSGTAQAFYDLIKYSDAGQITLVADTGSVTLDAKSSVNVEAPSGGGNAGTLSIRAQAGSFTLGGKLAGSAGGEARGGSFLLDVGSLPSLTPVNALLNEAGFDQSRSFRIRTGDVLLDGLATSHIFNVAADHGSIVVTGTGRIDASGATGGIINLMASESVTLESGASLTVAAREFSHAGKGGAVSLEAGSQRDGEVSGNGFVDIRTGSTIDLSVAAANVESASLGHFAGTLHLRAPQNAAHDDLQVATIGGTILGASNILVEGYRLYTPAGGTLSNALLSTINNDAKAFLGAAGTTTTAYTAMLQRLVGANPSVADQVILAPGVEIINRTGNLTLGTTSSTASSDWNFSTLRYGAKGAAGVLTLRAAGNLQFYNALSDGFVSSAYNAELLAPNALLPAGRKKNR